MFYNDSILKKCTICDQSKVRKDFYYRDKKRGRLHSQCKACYENKRRKIWKEHYHRYGDEYRARAIKYNKDLKVSLRKKMLKYLSDKSCVICGMNDPRVLEFDHINPSTKNISIARALSNAAKWDAILQEISKCQILCANCHKIKTAEQYKWYKNQIK